MNDHITTKDACRILGYRDPSSISLLVKQGRLTPAFKLPGKRGAFVFNRADVEAFAAKSADTGTDTGSAA